MNAFLQEARALIEQHLDHLVREHPHLAHAHLFSSARYSLLSSGKRLRPLLVLTTAAGYAIPPEQALTPACAIEMVHTYSLIHDDLPCMDDDDLRRGKPTLHKVFPEGHAVLTGDFLLTYAFEVLAGAPHISDQQKVALIHTLASHAGAHGMVGGQVIDLEAENKTVDWSTIELMHSYKTASLITACLLFGAIIGHAPLSDHLILQSAGKKIGIAFQIMNDVVDATAACAQVGKKTGADQNRNKSTAVSSKGVSECQQHAQELFKSAKRELSQLSRRMSLLEICFEELVVQRAIPAVSFSREF